MQVIHVLEAICDVQPLVSSCSLQYLQQLLNKLPPSLLNHESMVES